MSSETVLTLVDVRRSLITTTPALIDKDTHERAFEGIESKTYTSALLVYDHTPTCFSTFLNVVIVK